MTAPALNPITQAPTFPSGPTAPMGWYQELRGVIPDISFTAADGTIFYLQGGRAPDPLTHAGVLLVEGPVGMQAPILLLDETGARQDGTTNLDTVFDPAILHMRLEAGAPDADQLRAVVRAWMSAWNPPTVGALTYFTKQLGHWWMPVRQRKAVEVDKISQALEPGVHRRFRFDWEARGDDSFWLGPDSTSTFSLPTSETEASGFCPLTNLGTRPAFPRYLVFGPGTFTIGNGSIPTLQGTISNKGQPIPFGPLDAGQIAVVYTDPRLRSVVDLSPNQPAQKLTMFQDLIQDMSNTVAGAGPVPPLLQDIESVFGILPPQGPLYSLLGGRFTNLSQIDGKQDGVMPKTNYLPVSITGGNSASQIVAAITPMRTWPW